MNLSRHKRTACDFVYDETALFRECTSFAELAHDWRCPTCGAEKERFWRKPYIEKPRLRRHKSLTPFARDHGLELVCAQGMQ